MAKTSESLPAVVEAIDRARKELLDLTARNRLLNTPMRSKYSSYLHVVDEVSAEVFRTLYQQQKPMTFAAAKVHPRGQFAPTDDPDIGFLPQPDESDVDDRGVARRHADTSLQTQFTSEALQKRLLRLSYDAESFIEEQGVNILYLALGMLRWIESDDPKAVRHAPVLLVPVKLHRGNAAEKFRLEWSGEDPDSNLTLYLKLEHDFGIKLPAFPELDDLDLTQYFKAVRDAVASRPGWAVEENQIVLGFYSFAKFLMYRDLDEKTWPTGHTLSAHPLVGRLVKGHFEEQGLLIPEDGHVDNYIGTAEALHVVDADSSQTAAIHEVRNGRNLVIQGPPGTGKSQTITNLIAAAVHDGKRVLFLAEKLAALEVVKRRLDHIQLGPLCLELHSHKAQKRAVLDELRRTRELGRPAPHSEAIEHVLDRLRTQLNGHAVHLHEALEPTGLTPYLVLGHLLRLEGAGQQRPPVVLPEATRWAPSEVAARAALLAEIGQRAVEIGVPARHFWQGVRVPVMLRSDADLLAPVIRDIQQWTASLRGRAARVPALLGIGAPTNLAEVDGVVRFAQHLSQNPGIPPQLLTAAAWAGLQVLRTAIVDGRQLAALSPQVNGWFRVEAWQIDPRPMRNTLAHRGNSLFRFFHADYREAKKQLRQIAVDASVALPETLHRLDQLWEAQQLSARYQAAAMHAAEAFGPLWQGLASDWDVLERTVSWFESASAKGLPSTWTHFASAIQGQQGVPPVIVELAQASAALRQCITHFGTVLQFDTVAGFDAPEWASVDLAALEERAARWATGTEELSNWIHYNRVRTQALEIGLAPVVDCVHSGDLAGASALKDELLPFFHRSFYLSVFRAMCARQPGLAIFDGKSHDRLVEEFRRLDVDMLHRNRIRVLGQHYQQLPKNAGGGGAVGVLNGELAKKRRHLPIRQLLKQAATAVQAIKPVFMMSPLSVAQFLEPGTVTFDLLIVDEASQVQPVDALGAVARCAQIVVVGDDKQLPPTQFFQRMTSGEARDEGDDTAETGDVESILSLCQARGLDRRMLRWHYRSKHHSLIAVSNQEFYENKLYIVPSPYREGADLGLHFHHVPHGVYDSGGTQANAVEAQAVARTVMQHAREWPALTLGVAAFSVSQRDAILDELERIRRQEPDCEDFFTSESFEPFFVKNLENVQGDERDVIFISVGYGRNQHGHFAMRFGPLNNEGGERRLNVLISRARRRCEVFSGITADDIDLGRATGRGVQAFAEFLRFAQTGRLRTVASSAGGYQSPFEEAVAAALRGRGHIVDTQIGVAGFFIDLAIQDPEFPGRYLLGIECDGASYHSARSARDRDRLRQAVLEDHGWAIHRIWSTDWFQRPLEQLERVERAIRDAKQRNRDLAESRPNDVGGAAHPHVIERETADPALDAGLPVLPYQEAIVEVPLLVEIHNVPVAVLAQIVSRIVEIESPIHENEVVARVRMNWGLSRAGGRIQSAVKDALHAATREGRILRHQQFYRYPNRPVVPRDRSSVSSAGLKKAEHLPPMEVEEAVLFLVKEYMGATREELPQAILRIFGFKSTSVGLRTVVESAIDRLLSHGRLSENSGILGIPKLASPAGVPLAQ
jgi:very-short-patch-repair endonuclease